MLTLDVVQSTFGDALVLRLETAHRRHAILVDGGPSGTYARHLRGHLIDLAAKGYRLDLVVLSHIDNDHVTGLLELFSELRLASSSDDHPLPHVRELWHNAFSLSVGGADIAARVRSVLDGSAANARPLRVLTGTLMGVGEGDALRVAAGSIGVPMNERLPGGAALLDRTPPVRVGGLSIEVVGPSEVILAKLREQWLRWLARHGAAIASGRRGAAAAADRSVPNLSSIVLLVRWRGLSLLLTGDARGDHVIDGLRERGRLDGNGRAHVDLLKVPHHGSARNASAAFFRTVTADRYVISADGRYGNPDLPCLRWIIEAARDQSRSIELSFTNRTDAVDRLVRDYPPKRWGYTTRVLAPGDHSLPVPIGR